MSTKQDTRLTQDEMFLAMEIVSGAGAIATDGSGRVATPGTLGALLALSVSDASLAAARDQLAMAILERTSERAPGSLRERTPNSLREVRGVDAALAAQGLEINSTFITEPDHRLAAVRLLIDTAAGLAAQHYYAFGVSSPVRVEHPPARVGQWRLTADLRRHGSNPEIAARFDAWLKSADAALAGRIQIEANGFEITFWASSKAEIEAVHRYLDTFARATFLRPAGR